MAEPSSIPSTKQVALFATLFEIGLAALAFVVGWLVGFSPLKTVSFAPEAWSENAVAVRSGCLATIPVVVVFVLVDRYATAWSHGTRRVIQTLFSDTSPSVAVRICSASGIGEELLFRGLLQAGLCEWLGPPFGAAVGLTVASLAHGSCFLGSLGNFVSATLFAFYLGALFLDSDNLLAPIATHFTYGLFVLLYYWNWTSSPSSSVEKSKERE